MVILALIVSFAMGFFAAIIAMVLIADLEDKKNGKG